jgi:hypothetical protein
VDVRDGPRHLARIALKGPHHVLAVAASPDGALLAVSDAASVRLYQARALKRQAPLADERGCWAPAALPAGLCLLLRARGGMSQS